MRLTVFASRNGKELLRDPLSYLFCLGLPLMMLILMTIINGSIPEEAHMVIFRIDYLAPAITVFSFAFVMLSAALQVSKDRSTAFLARLYASPMRAADYLLGYTLPLLAIALGQCVVTYGTAAVIALVQGIALPPLGLLLSLLPLFPAAVLYLGFGLLFGTLLGEKAAPTLSSMVITLSCIMGGIFMDIDALGGTLKTICRIFPFYHAVRSSRAAVLGEYEDLWLSLLITALFAAAVYGAAVLVFRRKMRSDLR